MSEELERILARLTEPDNAVIQQVNIHMKLSFDAFNIDCLSKRAFSVYNCKKVNNTCVLYSGLVD